MSQIMIDSCMKTGLNVKTLIFRACLPRKDLCDKAIAAQRIYESYLETDNLPEFCIDFLIDVLTERIVKIH